MAGRQQNRRLRPDVTCGQPKQVPARRRRTVDSLVIAEGVMPGGHSKDKGNKEKRKKPKHSKKEKRQIKQEKKKNR